MATRSPSPSPTRPINHNPKTPDSSSLLRKSASSILSKPSNPQDILQRSSSSKPVIAAASVRSSYQHKENERDPSGVRPARARSPAVAMKGAKNFMAPTISASSKAIAASPRKKILAERNEVNPHPDSLQFPSKEGDESKLETGCYDHGGKVEEFAVKAEMVFNSEEILVKKQSSQEDSETEDGRALGVPLFSPPVIPPLDADPSLPPYDPKTNYLSPRPRFLHYKPNPRIEHCLHKEGDMDSLVVGDGKRLEDSFSLGSYEDTSGETEEIQSVCLQKGSEEDSSSLLKAEVEEDKDEPHVSELESKPKPSRKLCKPFSLPRSKLIPLLLVMVIACLSIPLSDSPIISSSSSSVLKDQSFSKLYAPALRVFEDLHLRDYVNEVVAVARVNCRGLADMFQHWSVNSIHFFTSLPFVPKEEEFALFHLANLTASDVDQSLELSYGVINPNEEDKSLESARDQVVEENVAVKRENFSRAEPENNAELELAGGVKEMDLLEDVEDYEAEEIEMEVKNSGEGEGEEQEMKASEVEVSGLAGGIDGSVVDRMGQNNEENEGVLQGRQNLEEVVGEEHKDFSHALVAEHVVKEDGSNLNPLTLAPPVEFTESRFESGSNKQAFYYHKLLESVYYGLKDRFSTHKVTGLISVVALVLAAAIWVSVCMKQKQFPSVMHENLLAKKVGSISGSSTSPLDKNFSMDVELMGDSGPSEVSSSLHSTSSYGQQKTKKAKGDETLSNEKRMRRDSTVSSSVSYGSFTSYERLSSKKGGRDESEVTPVRRSSRIRQLTSP